MFARLIKIAKHKTYECPQRTRLNKHVYFSFVTSITSHFFKNLSFQLLSFFSYFFRFLISSPFFSISFLLLFIFSFFVSFLFLHLFCLSPYIFLFPFISFYSHFLKFIFPCLLFILSTLSLCHSLVSTRRACSPNLWTALLKRSLLLSNVSVQR